MKWDKYLCFPVAAHQVGFALGKIKQSSSKKWKGRSWTLGIRHVVAHLSVESAGKEFRTAGK